jgi:hypothetical protein
VPIPGEAAHRSGIMPPTHSEMISPAGLEWRHQQFARQSDGSRLPA